MQSMDENGTLNPSYETTLKANRRTAEYRISNVEGWFRFAQSFFYKIDHSTQRLMTGRSTQSLDSEALEGMLTTGRSTQSLDSEALEGKLTTDRIHSFDIRHSTFIIRYSLFQSFFFDLTGRFFGRRLS
jgi:hypothetical protein